MKMTPGVLIVGALLVFWASAFIITALATAIVVRMFRVSRRLSSWPP